MKTIRIFYIIFCTLIILAVQGCGGKTEPPAGDDWYVTQKDIDELDTDIPDSSATTSFSKSELQGMRLFMHHCNRCHPAGDKGKGPSLIDKKVLPDFLIHFQIRNGLGDMPAFKKEELPKEDVKKIILFIRLLRRNTSPD